MPRLLDPVLSVSVGSGKVTIRPEPNGRLWALDEGSSRPPLRIDNRVDPQLVLSGVPPTHGVLAGVDDGADRHLELTPAQSIAAIHGAGVWLLAIRFEQLGDAVREGQLVTTDRVTGSVRMRRRLGDLAPFPRAAT